MLLTKNVILLLWAAACSMQLHFLSSWVIIQFRNIVIFSRSSRKYQSISHTKNHVSPPILPSEPTPYLLPIPLKLITLQLSLCFNSISLPRLRKYYFLPSIHQDLTKDWNDESWREEKRVKGSLYLITLVNTHDEWIRCIIPLK